MKRAFTFLYSLLLVFFYCQTMAQKYYFDNFSVKEGLSQSKVYDVVQDQKGFIWLATASGASRFDGNTFQNYTSDDGLAENGVRTMCVDSKGNIWFGHTGGGVSIYDGKKFIRVLLDTIRHENDITCIIEDYKHRIWISTQGAGAFMAPLEGFDPTRHQPMIQYTGKTRLSDRVFGITQTRDGKLFFIIDGMIKIYQEEEKSFTVYRHPGLSYFFQITCMIEDRDSNLWFGTYNGGLYRQNKQTGNVSVFYMRDGLADNFVSCLAQDKSGDIWVGTWGGGITRIDPNFLTFNQDNGLAGNKIWKILEDREGNILIGTNDNGLSIFKGEHFISYLPEHGLLSEQVSTITSDNQNNILIGTNKGLCKLNLTSGTIKALKLSDSSLGKEIIALKKASDGIIWIATKEDGIYSYDPIKDKISYNTGFNSVVLRYGKLVTCMEIDNDNHIWVGTIDGLFYLEPEKEAYNRLMGNEISTLFFDKDKTMWVSAKGKGIITVMDTSFTRVDTLGNITALCMTQDFQGNIWLGTEGQGIMVYSPEGTIIRYKVANGLLADLVTSLVTDKSGNIWVGTNKGLNKYSVGNGSFLCLYPTKRVYWYRG